MVSLILNIIKTEYFLERKVAWGGRTLSRNSLEEATYSKGA